MGLARLGDIGGAGRIDQRVGAPIVRVLVRCGSMDHDLRLEFGKETIDKGRIHN
jgi:hypothetical protein